MKFGLTVKQYQFILDEVVTPLCEVKATVFCFGSRARGDHGSFSDLDLMIEGSQDVDLQLGRIRERLESSNFPYKVDLVKLSEFATSFRDNYENEKVAF